MITIQTNFTGTLQDVQEYVHELNWLIKDERFAYDVYREQIEFWGNELSQDTILDFQITGEVSELEFQMFNFHQDFITI